MTPQELPPRTLRCANGALYLVMALALNACALWAALTGRLSGASWGIAALAGLCSLLWALYYATLHWQLDAQGLTRRVYLLRKKTYPWQQLRSAKLHEEARMGVGVCRIYFEFAEGVLCLSSELIPLDDMETLRDDLREIGILTNISNSDLRS